MVPLVVLGREYWMQSGMKKPPRKDQTKLALLLAVPLNSQYRSRKTSAYAKNLSKSVKEYSTITAQQTTERSTLSYK